MTWQLTPYTVPLALATAMGSLTAALVLRRRDSAAETWGALVQVSIATWALVHLLVVSSVGLESKERWFGLVFPVIAALVVSMFCFSLHYTGRKSLLTRRRAGLLLTHPLLALVLGVTNRSHELLYVDPAIDASGSFAQLTYAWGPGFYVFATVNYALSAAFVALVFQKFRHSRNVYRKISFVLFASILVLVGVTVASTFRVSPTPHYTLLPLSYLGVGVVLVLVTTSLGFVRLVPVDELLSSVSSRFDDIVPLARDVIVEAVDNGIVVLDAEGRIVDVNETGRRMLGVDRAVGRRLSDIVDVDRIMGASDLERLLVEDAELEELRDEVWVDVGSEERCYDVAVSELGGGDDPAGYVVLMHDITRQKDRESQLREREAQLERRTAELERQKAKLEHQNDRLDRFAGIVTHDLRNPLTVASGRLELVEKQLDGDSGTAEIDAETLDVVRNSHERMADIIDDALEMARQGKAVTDTDPVALAPAAEDAWGNVNTGAATLVVDAPASIEAERGRLLTLFENLFRNAVEHGAPSPLSRAREGALEQSTATTGSETTENAAAERRQSGGERNESAETETPAGADLTVRVGVTDDTDGFFVVDDGTGIPDDQKDDVLEHGYSTSDDGTGFGLSIVRDVVGAHGWHLDLEDGEAGGARFEITGVDLVGSDADGPD